MMQCNCIILCYRPHLAVEYNRDIFCKYSPAAVLCILRNYPAMNPANQLPFANAYLKSWAVHKY